MFCLSFEVFCALYVFIAPIQYIPAVTGLTVCVGVSAVGVCVPAVVFRCQLNELAAVTMKFSHVAFMPC